MRRIGRWMAVGAATVCALALAVNVAMLLLAPSFTFQSSFSHDEDYGVPVTREVIPGPEGTELEVLTVQGPEGAPVLVYFHGNKGRLAYILRDASRYATVISPAYPGYSRSTGEPSVAGIEGTVDAVLSWLHERGMRDIDLRVLGHSMGGYPALYAAVHYPELRRVFLVNTFHSMQRMCEHRIGTAGCLLTSGFLNSAALAPAARVPIRQFHSTQDELIPFGDGKELFGLLGSADKEFGPISGIHREFNVDWVLGGGL